MSTLKEVFQWQTLAGDKVTVGGITVTPKSQALTIRWPNGGLVWNRPTAILVERDGQPEQIPIVDVTRLTQVGLLGLALSFTVFGLLISIRRRRD